MTDLFEGLLDTNLDEVEKPKPLPEGSYLTRVVSYEETISSKKKTPGLKFTFEIIEPMDDVDESEIEAVGGVVGKNQRTTYWLTEGSMFMLKEFLEEHVGVDIEGQKLSDAIQAAVNEVVVINVSHRMTDDDRIFAEIKSTAAAE